MGWIDATTAAAVALALASTPAVACTAEAVARLPLTTFRGLPVVGMEINGHALPMILDTGAQYTVVTPEAAQEAGLVPDRRYATKMHGITGLAGDTWNYDSAPVALSLGNLDLGTNRLRIAAIIGREGLGQVAGALGADFLSRHDLELDIPHSTATIYDIHGCVGDFVPWLVPHDRVESAWSGHDQTQMTIPSSIGAMPVRTFIDTGAAASMITRRAATAAGTSDAAMTASTPVTGIDGLGMPIAARSFAFQRLQVGNETFAGVSVLVCDCDIPNADMQIGEDFISSRKLWLSYQTGQVFIVRAGRDAR